MDFPGWSIDCRPPEVTGTDVLHLKLPGMDMVVLSTSEAISDLLDQRSAIYSDKVRVL